MSEWVIAMNIKPGELYRYEIKDEIKELTTESEQLREKNDQ